MSTTTYSHLVFGTGLTGGFLLGALKHAGLNATALARPSNAGIWEQGLELSDYNDNHCQVEAPDRINQDQAHPFDIIWLTVKCTATDAVVEQLKAFVGPETCIVCCQNGFGSDQIIRTAFPNNRVENAIVGFNVAAASPAHLRRATEGDFVISKTLADAYQLDFGSDVMPLQISEDMLASRWAKLQLNLANAVNALANVPVKTMLEQRAYRKVIAAIMRELLLVVERKNIKLPKVAAVPGKWMPLLMTLPDGIYSVIAQSTLAIDPSARTSMWWDLKNQVGTEIDFINGAVSEAGKQLGIATPANDALINLVKAVENGSQERSWTAEEFYSLIVN